MKTDIKGTKKLDFTDQNFFIGLDVHKKEWAVSVHSQDYELKTFTQPADPAALIKHLQSNYPNGNFKSVYEAGFSGYWIHRYLEEHGIHNIVVNPSDIPTTNKEITQKRDKIDARKLARGLRADQLTPVYVPNDEILEERYLLRQRKKFVQDITRCKNRIKSELHFLGIKIPQEYDQPYWKKAFKHYLREECPFKTTAGKIVIATMLDELETIESCKRTLEKEITKLSKEKYKDEVMWLKSIPGIGLLCAMTIITEIVDINRFKKLDNLYSYIGLIPNCHSSGEKDYTGRITQRCNQYLRPILMQCAWRAIKVDPEMLHCFMELSKSMKKNKAIVRIARKQISRVNFVLKNKKCLE
jgi:transposase